MKGLFTHSELAGNARWMVVDDDANILSLMQTVLAEFSNADIQYFNSPDQALAAFADHPEAFRMVITDLEMPAMSGIELSGRLQKLSPRLKVLLVTGSGILTEAEAIQKGFCGLLRKPFLLTSLHNALMAAGALELRAENYSKQFTALTSA